MLQQHLNKKKGFSTTTIVIILSFVSVLIVSSSLLASTDTFLSSNQILSGVESKALANSCAEVALNALKLDNTYAGNQNINLGNGTCNILSISGSGNTNRIFGVRATVRNVTRELEVSVQTINPTTILNYWRELDL